MKASRLDLPEPLGPMIVRTAPGATVQVTGEKSRSPATASVTPRSARASPLTRSPLGIRNSPLPTYRLRIHRLVSCASLGSGIVASTPSPRRGAKTCAA